MKSLLMEERNEPISSSHVIFMFNIYLEERIDKKNIKNIFKDFNRRSHSQFGENWVLVSNRRGTLRKSKKGKILVEKTIWQEYPYNIIRCRFNRRSGFITSLLVHRGYNNFPIYISKVKMNDLHYHVVTTDYSWFYSVFKYMPDEILYKITRGPYRWINELIFLDRTMFDTDCFERWKFKDYTVRPGGGLPTNLFFTKNKIYILHRLTTLDDCDSIISMLRTEERIAVSPP